MKTAIRIKGMTCGHCEKRVESALGNVVGITSVSVNLEMGTAVVGHNDNVDVSELIAAVVEAGYEASTQ